MAREGTQRLRNRAANNTREHCTRKNDQQNQTQPLPSLNKPQVVEQLVEVLSVAFSNNGLLSSSLTFLFLVVVVKVFSQNRVQQQFLLLANAFLSGLWSRQERRGSGRTVRRRSSVPRCAAGHAPAAAPRREEAATLHRASCAVPTWNEWWVRWVSSQRSGPPSARGA